MAASSPSLSSNGLSAAATPPKTLRGLNKPKCIQCGNVARSRCPFQSCKGCCSRAENPCPIHVLKAATGCADKSQGQSTPASEQKLSEGTSGSTSRFASIRKLSSNFAQFNNLNSPLRPRKPLTTKDALALNEWRFSKLKEYRDKDIEAENEAFDQYMKNVNLLEEVFSLTSVAEENNDATIEQKVDEGIISELKLRLRANPSRTESYRARIREIVNQGLGKLQNPELDDNTNDEDEQPERRIKRAKSEERASALSEIIDKLNKARTEEDLKSCTEMKSKLYNRRPAVFIKISVDNASEKSKDLPSFVRRIEIGEEALKRIDEHYCSLENIGVLTNSEHMLQHPATNQIL